MAEVRASIVLRSSNCVVLDTIAFILARRVLVRASGQKVTTVASYDSALVASPPLVTARARVSLRQRRRSRWAVSHPSPRSHAPGARPPPRIPPLPPRTPRSRDAGPRDVPPRVRGPAAIEGPSRARRVAIAALAPNRRPPPPPRPRSVRASAPRDAPRDAFQAPRDTPLRARTPEAPRLTLPPPASSSSSARPTFPSLPPRHPGKGTTTTPRGSLPSATSTDATSGRATTATSPARNRTELATTLTRGPHRCASCPPPPPSPP